MVTSTAPVGATSCTFVGTTSAIPVTLSMLFQFSTSGVPEGSFSNAVILTPSVAEDSPTLNIVTIESEDVTDNNGNNTIVTIVVSDPDGFSSSIATGTSSEVLTSRSGIIVSNDGIDINIADFSGNSTTTGFVAHTSAWGKVAGRVTDHKTPGNWANYLVLQFLFSENTSPEMDKATMIMSAMVPYVRYDSLG